MDLDRQSPFVLIADDNRDLAKGLAILLKLAGFDVEIVRDGRDALQAALARRPDAILLDVGLPGMDGFQVGAQIRSDQRLKDIFVIGISAYDDVFLDQSRPKVFDCHLAKPFTFETVRSLLARLC
jgi:CheY-like chemotaxis protein